MTKILMTDNGPVAEGLLDGYSIGDRLLEGVMFRILIVNNEITCPGVVADHEDYMVQFSTEQRAKWNESAVESCIQWGDNLRTADGEDIWIEVAEAPAEDPLVNVRTIEAESFGDISKRILGKLTPKDSG